jgi:hypothetical protein
LFASEPLQQQQSVIACNRNQYPTVTSNSASHQLAHCTRDETLFVVYFNPRHLEFFLRSTGNRFPHRYVWWQVEQASNAFFFDNPLYRATIGKALALLEFSRFNCLSIPLPTLYTPFSRDPQHLLYTPGEQRLHICDHQRRRLRQDNPHFTASRPAIVGQVLLLGTCETERRQEFKRLCEARGLMLEHPQSFNYLFGLDRQDYIAEFVQQCRGQAVAVNIHQYEHSMLEQAKIFLLLANGCDIVVSERSHAPAEDAMLAAVCGAALIFVDSLAEAVDIVDRERHKARRAQVRGRLENPAWHANHFRRLSAQLLQLF